MRQTCQHPDCRKKRHARGFCEMHYARLMRHGDPDAIAYRCRVPSCDDKVHARGICRHHYDRWRSGEEIGVGPGMFGIFARTECEQCSDEPMGGGRWCLAHFQQYVREQDRLNPDRLTRRSSGHGTAQARLRHRQKGERYCPDCYADSFDWIEVATKEPAA